MIDIIPPEDRSRLMAGIGQRNTKPEIRVRRTAHAMGLRFRLHRRDLPGTPDLVFPKLRVALFVHGCFWHRHPGCPKASMPKSRIAFWQAKFAANIDRDARVMSELEALGWRPEVIWECETGDPARLTEIIRERVMGPDGPGPAPETPADS